MDRNRYYWELHKEVWIEKFDGLPSFVRNKILDDPHGHEGKRLERVVDREIQASLASLRKSLVKA
jgi:hypothetical protein